MKQNEKNTEETGPNSSLVEQKLNFLLETSSLTCFEVSLEGSILFISPNIRQLSGYNADELQNRSMWNLYEDMNARERLIEKLMKDNQVLEHQIDLRDKDGRIRSCIINVILLHDVTGNPVTLFGTLNIAD